MDGAILFNDYKEQKNTIDTSALKASSLRQLSEKIIAPAKEEYKNEIVDDHAADPIKSLDDIEHISEYLIENKRYRDNMLFIVGINFGLRISDLLSLRFGDIINDNFTFKDTFAVFEKKTRNTRKKKKNRYITINRAVMEAVTLYLENKPGTCLSDYMFRGEGNRSKNSGKPLNRRTVNRLFEEIAKDLKLNIQFSTHSLRKTFGYHQMVMSNNDQRKLLVLQKMFNHSSPMQTLDYIGITGEEIEEAYKQLNLGSKHNYLVGSDIIEFEEKIV